MSEKVTARVALVPPEKAPAVVKPKKACDILDCGLTRLYELLGSGEIESFKDGASRKIVTASIFAYLARKQAVGPQLKGHLA